MLMEDKQAWLTSNYLSLNVVEIVRAVNIEYFDFCSFNYMFCLVVRCYVNRNK